MDDDFAFLSDDIVYDVLQFAHFERLSTNSPSMKPLGGRWGEIAKTYSYFKLVDNEIEEYRLDGHSVPFTAATKNRKDVAINSICLYGIREFNEIEHLAANAYESLEVYCDDIPKKFLENLGNRFTSIIWWNANKSQTKIDFLKRQLKSPHLRNLECDGPVLTRPDFIDLLVDFVRKTNFETLNDSSFSRKGISERVFFAAYEAWLQRKEENHLPSSVSAWISTKDLHELTARIPNCSWNKRSLSWGPDWSYNERHPTANYYQMLITYDDYATSEVKKLTMTLSRGHTKHSY